MSIKFQADNDLKSAIVNGVKRRQPAIDFQSALKANLDGVPDDSVLRQAASEGRILVTHDRRTMPIHFTNFISTHESAGVILIAQRGSLIEAIDDLVLIWEATSAEDWKNQLAYLPL